MTAITHLLSVSIVYRYVIGIGEKLTLFEKGWLRNKSSIIHSGEGFVRSIKWRRNFIAWANSQGEVRLQ